VALRIPVALTVLIALSDDVAGELDQFSGQVTDGECEASLPERRLGGYLRTWSTGDPALQSFPGFGSFELERDLEPERSEQGRGHALDRRHRAKAAVGVSDALLDGEDEPGGGKVAQSSLGPSMLEIGVLGQGGDGDVAKHPLDVADRDGEAHEIDELEDRLEQPDEGLAALRALLAGRRVERGKGRQDFRFGVERLDLLRRDGENSRIAPGANRNGPG
jgi:hypothetical protein